MLNISRGRSSSVPQNRFLRRLILHFDLLQDETATMNQATTILFLLVNLYIQIVPTNNTVDSSLNMLLGSAKMVPTIFSAGLFVSIILLLILLVSLIFENKYLDRNCTLDPPKHLKSVWYKFYKHLFRFHFLLLEPILSGYTLSLILPKSAFDVYPLRFQVFAIVGGTLGLLLSIPYFCLVESILPSSSWTSATNKYNIALTTIGLRLCIFLDYVYTSATDMALIGILMVIRISPSIIATYINLFATHFFNKHARVLFVGYQVSNIIYSIIFFVMGNDSTSLTLIPACFFIALGLRAVYNMDLMSRANLQHLSANKLSDILTLASHITDSQKENVVSASTEALRFQAVMAHLTSGRKELYEEYCETFASTDEKAHDNERNTSLFMVYLFERCWQSSGQKDFRTLVYETLFALTMRLNLFHISTMLARLHSLDLNVVEQSTLRALIRRIELSAKEIYLDKLSLIPVREQFYAPKSVAETNEAIANKLKLNNIEDDSRDYGDQAKTHVTAKVIRSSDLLHFDIYSSMQTIEQYEKLVNRMQDVIFTILKFYDKLKNRVVDVANAHETMKRIKILKEKVNKAFRTLDKSSGDQNIFHLLPYALFLETINNDRQASQKVLKAYEHRSQLLERSMNMSRGRTSSSKFSLDQMLCISVDCTRNSLGRMNYISSNSEEVFGLHPKHFEGRNIHTLMSDDFQTIHDEFLDKFVKDQDKPYLGVSRERHVRVHDNVYTKCDVLVKLSPVLNPTSLSFMCLLKKRVNDEEFIVINHQGVIIGRSQALDWADSMLRKKLGVLAPIIPDGHMNTLKRQLIKNYATIKRLWKHSKSTGALPPLGNVEHLDSTTFMADDGHAVPNSGILNVISDKLLGRVKPALINVKDKKVFVDLLLGFEAGYNIKAEGTSLKRKQDGYQASMSISENTKVDPLVSRLPPAPPVEQIKRVKFNRPKRILQASAEVKVASPKNIPSVVGSSLGKKGQDEEASKGYKNPANLAKDYKNPANLAKGLIIKDQTKKTKEEGGEGGQQDPAIENIQNRREKDEATSMGSSVNAGSIYTVDGKAKILATIKHRLKYIAWKELVAMALIQIVIFNASGISNQNLDNKFVYDMKSFIDLRTGFSPLLMSMTSAFNTGYGMMERMLIARDKITPDKFNVILPSIVRNIDKIISLNIRTMQNWSLALTTHVFSFDYKLAERYLAEKYIYRYYYHSEELESNDTMTKPLNLLSYTSECIYTAHRWSAGFDLLGRQLRFNNRLPAEYYELMTRVWEGVVMKTMSNILDRDTESYQVVIASATRQAVLMIGICLLLSVLTIFLALILRRKIARFYTIIEHLQTFELILMQNRLKDLDITLKESRHSEIRTKAKSNRSRTAQDFNYHRYGQRANLPRLLLRTKLRRSTWFGIGRVSCCLFSAILLYQVLVYETVDNLSKDLNRVLMLQGHQRTLLTTTSYMSVINFNAYYIAVKAANYGTRSLPDFKNLSSTLADYGKKFDDSVSQLDKFITQVPTDKDSTLNFVDLLTDKPCDYLNYKFYSLPLSECESLAGHTFSKSVMEAYRWIRMEMPMIIQRLQTLNVSTNPLAYLTSEQFLTFEFTRRNFFSDFVYKFSTKFFDQLKIYHQKRFAEKITGILLAFVVVLGVVMVILVGFIIRTTLTNVDAGLQVFLLVPPESYYHNPHIAAKLLTITR